VLIFIVNSSNSKGLSPPHNFIEFSLFSSFVPDIHWDKFLKF